MHDGDPCPKGGLLHRSGNLDHLTLGCLLSQGRSHTLLAHATKANLQVGDQQREPSVGLHCWSCSLNYRHWDVPFDFTTKRSSAH
jgi:hypothetical protein